MPAIKGLDQFLMKIKQLEKLPKAFADEFKKRVTDRSPVRTGLLKDSWDIQVKPGVLELRNKATNEEGQPYTAYVEFGTYKQAPVLMISTTLLEKNDILKVAKKNTGL
jgi:hypothetical protein